MSTRLSLGKPYIVASLPRSIDQSKSRYVVGNVCGAAQGSRKRKRPELAVGVDGEGVNLYDVSSSKLITSYALPPQTSFTCPPLSLRTRLSKGTIERRTYVSTGGDQFQITLFCESIDGQLSATSSTVTRTLEKSSTPVVYLGTITASRRSAISPNTCDVLVVKENGEVSCLDGDSLQDKWISPSTALDRESSGPLTQPMQVEFALLSSAFAASQGILKNRQDLLSIFPEEVSEGGFNPDVLVIIRKFAGLLPLRTVHVVTLPRKSAMHTPYALVETLLSTTIPSTVYPGKATFNLQVSTGILQQFTPTILTTFDFTTAVPKEISQVKIGKDGHSFLRLSSTSTMVSNSKSITVYNPKYQSILASIQLGGSLLSDISNRKRRRVSDEEEIPIGVSGRPFELVSYFPKLNIATAIADNDLIAIQIEGKSRGTGLLIDSLGSPVRMQTRLGRDELNSDSKVGLKSMGAYLPGSMGLPEVSMSKQCEPTDVAFRAGDATLFDNLMAEKLGGTWNIAVGNDQQQLENGPGPTIEAPCSSPRPSDMDKRWVVYTLRRIFSWSAGDDVQNKLGIRFYPPNVFMWLLQTGHMTITNIKSALRNKICSSAMDALPTGKLVSVLVDMDQSMGLLYALISKNLLPAGELVYAIRILMESLGLFGDNEAATQQAIMDREDSTFLFDNHNIDDEVKELEAQIESDLALAESRLSDGIDTRGDALDLALARLYKCPSEDVVYALQTIFTGQETMALIYQLRFQLRNGSWTSRYADMSMLDDISVEEEQQENSMMVICSLLHNCVDSIGAGGWISGDLRLVNGDPFEAEEFISGLSFEVNAALEGIEEAEYLRGLLQCMVRYGQTVQGPPKRQKAANTPLLLPLTDEAGQILPIGLKVNQKIGLKKIAGGGEILRRSMREIGRLKSKKVGKYSLERIVV